jgi:hypothetical protein
MPTSDQEIFLEGIVSAGGIAIVARSVDFVNRILDEIGEAPAIPGARYNEEVPKRGRKIQTE